ncbi:hypothetical protein [Streptomyces sp. Tue6028]
MGSTSWARVRRTAGSRPEEAASAAGDVTALRRTTSPTAASDAADCGRAT